MTKLLRIMPIVAGVIAVVLLVASFLFTEVPRTIANTVVPVLLATVFACVFLQYFLIPEVAARATVLTMHVPKPWKPGVMETTFLIEGKKVKLELTLEQFKSITKGETVFIKYKGPRVTSIMPYPSASCLVDDCDGIFCGVCGECSACGDCACAFCSEKDCGGICCSICGYCSECGDCVCEFCSEEGCGGILCFVCGECSICGLCVADCDGVFLPEQREELI